MHFDCRRAPCAATWVASARSHWTPAIVVLGVVVLAAPFGCQPTPKLESDTLHAMADVAGAGVPIEFRKIERVVVSK